MNEWVEEMTRIGNAAGLEGRFLVEFGFEQLEAKVRELKAAEGSAEVELTQTCGACPEQYDAHILGVPVAYFRLRHGYFAVQCPWGGETVYSSRTYGDGIFDEDERDRELSAAKRAVWTWVQTSPNAMEIRKQIAEARERRG